MTPKDDRWLVDVVVEARRVGSAWRFENFRYVAPPDDLLSLLRRLHAP